MSLIDCSKVEVKNGPEMGLGAFAKCDINKGDIVEYGIVKRIDTDGNNNPYLFTWSEDRSIWAFASGCLTFYNTLLDPNCKVIRHFDEDRVVVIALKDIKIGEELTHKYKSLEWRSAFEDVRNILNINK